MFLKVEKIMTIFGKNKGFALIEVLIAMSIISVVILSIYSGVSAGAVSISQTKDLTNAVMIAKSKLNEFKLARYRGTDLNNQEVENFPGFTYDREIKRFEHELFPRIPAQIVTITVKWEQKNIEKEYKLEFVYATR